jgi:putative N-acetylmannosamine-6-phosphate epimerase
VTSQPLGEDITNAEVAAAFGADLILLNNMDVMNPVVMGLYDGEETMATAKPRHDGHIIKNLQHLVGCPIGVNLEPIDVDADMLEERLEIVTGRTATPETLAEVERLGYNFVVLTGNPGTGVTNEQIVKNIKIAKQKFSGLVIAGKMHAAGVNEPLINPNIVKEFIDAGADVILVPAVGTVPGLTDDELTEIVKIAHEANALVMSTIGTSQESGTTSYIENIAIRNKIYGVDIQHIGDAGYGGMAPVENIFTLSKAIRGQRHTVSRMARSINR